MEDTVHKISLKSELLRKGIHILSVVIPISYYFLDKNILLIFTGVSSLFMIITELIRKYSVDFDIFYRRVLGLALRHSEKDVKAHLFTGGTYYILGIFFTILLFPREIAACGILIMIISDSCAALAGKTFGTHRIFNKTLEGSIAFFLSGAIIIFLTPKISHQYFEYYIAIISLIITTFIELIPWKLDDNFTVPISFSAIYFLLINLF